jgi:rhodanese-related sulfurtransferase
MRLIRLVAALLFIAWPAGSVWAEPIPNKLIDSAGFLSDIRNSHAIRAQRRLTEDDFSEMAKDRNTTILDARSANRFEQMHIVGAKNLPFTDFTDDTLKALIPSKDTRILIYCNNNIKNSQIAFASKAPAASLNLSTFPSLYTYGYRTVFELGPVIDPAKSKIKFEGSLTKSAR